MHTPRPGLMAALVLLALFVATPALGQAWRGVPLPQMQTGIGANAAFPDYGNLFGLEAFRRLEMFTVGAEYGLSTFEGDASSAHRVGVNGALDLALALDTLGVRLAPVAGISYSIMEDINVLQVPVGASIAYIVSLTPDMSVVPYAVPRLLWSRISYDEDVGDGDIDATTDTDFGFTVGGNLMIRNLFVGLSFGKVGDGDGLFGINAGYLVR
jgi:hypothetical protein